MYRSVLRSDKHSCRYRSDDVSLTVARWTSVRKSSSSVPPDLVVRTTTSFSNTHPTSGGSYLPKWDSCFIRGRAATHRAAGMHTVAAGERRLRLFAPLTAAATFPSWICRRVLIRPTTWFGDCEAISEPSVSRQRNQRRRLTTRRDCTWTADVAAFRSLPLPTTLLWLACMSRY